MAANPTVLSLQSAAEQIHLRITVVVPKIVKHITKLCRHSTNPHDSRLKGYLQAILHLLLHHPIITAITNDFHRGTTPSSRLELAPILIKDPCDSCKHH